MPPPVAPDVTDQSVVAKFVVDADAFALGRTLREYPELTVRLERIVPLGESVIPYLWIEDGTVSHIVETVAADPGVEDVSVVDEVDGWALVRTDWTVGGDGLVASITGARGRVLEAVGSADRWSLQLRFPSHGALATFYEGCAEQDIDLHLDRVVDFSTPEEELLRFAMTDLQRETLLVALAEGYFSVPRQTSLEELAEELEVSDTAVSQRLRRGLEALVRATLGPEQSEE